MAVTAPELTLPALARMMREAITDRSYQQQTRLGSDVADYLAWARLNLAARSLVIYEGYLARLCVLLAEEDPSADEVTAEMLLRGLNEYNTPSLRIVKTAYNNFFSWACRWGRCDKNPVDLLPRLREAPQKVYDVFTAAEQARLIKAADALPMPRLQRLRVLCFVELGVRKDEARWLRPSDFDPIAKVVVVTHGKGGKQRIVDIGDDLWRAFVQYRNTPIPRVRAEDERGFFHEDRTPADDDFLFFPFGASRVTGQPTWTNPRTQWSPRSIHNWWVKVVDEAGVKYRSLHMNRHTVGTDLATAGADSFEIQDWLGHADPGTTKGYVHNSRARLNKARTRLDEYRRGQTA